MTPTSLSYLLLGLATLLLPVATVLTRRRILGAQWFLIAAMIMAGITFILYSCLFNTFLHGEYLLMLMYMGFALFTPPVAVLAVAIHTRPDGATRVSRAAVWLPLLTAAGLVASIVIGGTDMYRLWIFRGSVDEADYFFAHSWRYNLIVTIHYYLFSGVLFCEVVFVALYALVHLRRYNRTLAEYFPAEYRSLERRRLLYVVIVVVSAMLALSAVLFPLNLPRPVPFTALSCVVMGMAFLLLGYWVYRMSYSAEALGETLAQSTLAVRHDLGRLGREISAYVERSAYLDPYLSVFQLANHFRVSQDQVVDAIHKMHGVSFGDWVDGMRVEHAATLLAHAGGTDDYEALARMAHQCGYLTPEALEAAFERVMHMPLSKWGQD